MIDPGAVFRRRDDVRFRRLPPEGVVVRQTDPEVLVLNELASRILERIDGETSVQAVVEGLLAEYEVDPSVLERDVLEFLEELQRSGIIVSVFHAR